MLKFYLPSFVLMYYAAGILWWLGMLAWSKDEFGWQRLRWYGAAVFLLIFTSAAIWPMLLLAFLIVRLIIAPARHRRSQS